MISIIGIVSVLAIAFLLSEDRSAVQVRYALQTIILIIVVAAVALLTPVGAAILDTMRAGVSSVIEYANEGIEFAFGPLALPENGFIVAFQILPIIIFIASLVSVLFHIGVMNLIIRVIGGTLRFVTGATRLESTVAAANIFVGMIESPLTILPYLKKMTRSQIFVLMSCGLSSVAGTVLVAYAAMGVDLNLLLVAAFLGAPGGLLFGRILVPETEEQFDISSISNASDQADEERAGSIVEAATSGALMGMQIMISVIAVLVAFIALIALLNGILGGLGGLVGFPQLSMELILGYVFAPLMFLIGVPWDEAMQAGVFFGQKIILTDFIAYTNFVAMMDSFSTQGSVAMTVAICGFANLGGAGILVAGLTAVMPERKRELSQLGLKAVLAGALSNLHSAGIVSALMALKALV